MCTDNRRSSWYPVHYGYAPAGVRIACQVLRSFYNYLRYHRVCPQYDSQLQAALKICDMAETELVKVDIAGLALPGDFNTSASTLSGGAQAGVFAGNRDWAQQAKDEGVDLDAMGPRDEEARIKFNTGVAALGTDDQQGLIGGTNLKIIDKQTTGLEIMSIELPDDITREVYARQSEIVSGKLAELEPLGKLKCKTWYADDCNEWDLPRDNYPDNKPHKVEQKREYEFWVEESVLKKCFVGMKMETSVITLEGGLKILDEVLQTHCSFYTFLANELWMENKPKAVRVLAKALPDYDKQGETNGAVEDGQKKDQACGDFDDE